MANLAPSLASPDTAEQVNRALGLQKECTMRKVVAMTLCLTLLVAMEIYSQSSAAPANRTSSTISYWKSLWPNLRELRVNGSVQIFIDPKLIISEKAVGYHEDSEIYDSYGQIRISSESEVYDILEPDFGLSTNVKLQPATDNYVRTARGKYFGDILCIPNNGYVYSLEQPWDLDLTILAKYKYLNGEFKEVVQPYYSCGIETSSKYSIDLKNQDTDEVIVSIPAGTRFQIIGFSRTVFKVGDGGAGLLEGNLKYLFLIRSPSGLIGWHQLEIYPDQKRPGYFTYSIPIVNMKEE